MRTIEEEGVRMKELVESERRSREETEEQILEMLSEMVGRIKQEIESEKKERETSEEQLLLLLEETCSKLAVSSPNA